MNGSGDLTLSEDEIDIALRSIGYIANNHPGYKPRLVFIHAVPLFLHTCFHTNTPPSKCLSSLQLKRYLLIQTYNITYTFFSRGKYLNNTKSANTLQYNS